MKNKGKETELPAILTSNDDSTFDDIFDRDDKQVSKEQKKVTAKNGKRIQLLGKISELNVKISTAEINYTNSLTNPQIDSVQKAIDLKVLREEQRIALDIFSKLFPEEAKKFIKAIS